tara:strand:- start:1017 stop:1883 length:867 start_codon:yes stop_codon:yes gene_type:complete
MSTLLDRETREPLFEQGEPYTLRQFIKIAKRSAEGKKAYKGGYNFGKGIKLAEYLRKNIPAIAKSMKATVYRSAWNYGENLTVTIELGGKSYNQTIFKFGSANSTRQPTYSFATMFNGAIKPSNPGKPVRDFGMGTIHGSYQSISQFDEFMSDIVGIFNDYERLYGRPFDMKTALAEFKKEDKIRAAWSKVEPKVEKQYAIAKENARKVSRWIELRSPRLSVADKAVYYKTDEPRELRHPDEYGDSADRMLNSKEYTKYENAQAKISDLIEPFCKKFGLEFVWAASWN